MDYHNNGVYDLALERSYNTPLQNSSLLPLVLMALATQKHTPDTKSYFKNEYDYIVVGAGSAGSVVASRLSEDPSKTVLLLEAGKSPPLLTDLPASAEYLHGTDLFWNYETEPQKYGALNHEDRRLPSISGKTVGGTSTLNGMFYVRANRYDYNSWAEMGARGWEWCNVFPYFLKSEGNTDPYIANNGFHSCDGPMSVSTPQNSSEYEMPLIKTVTSLGYPFVDSNGARQIGFAYRQVNTIKGQRESSAKAYLVPAENRPNLDIVAEAYVTKVLIENRKACGVQFDFKGSRYEVAARREVIVSAGTLKSPQVLMLSGIGPKRTLEKFGIPVIADLPVGQNFQDHPMTELNFVSTKGDRQTISEKIQDPENIFQFINHRTGPLTVWSGYFGNAFLADNETAQCLDISEYQVYFYEAEFGKDVLFGLTEEAYYKFYGPYLDMPVIICSSVNVSPKSRGYISIRSKNPYDPPVINPNFYEVREDILRVVEGMKTCYRIMQSPMMKKLGFKPFETLMPGCEDLEGDEYLECYARSFIGPNPHQAASVRMGDINDPTAVLDSHLRVKGIKGLRVVDASVMPMITRGNTQTPTQMIAEKASDMIKSCSNEEYQS